MAAIATQTQVSAGGVAFRRARGKIKIALISVGEQGRWQLPKGLVDRGETSEAAAMREVREEAGIETELVQSLDKIEYWYYSTQGKQRVRVRKFVHFYLLRYRSGSVQNHDQEVNAAHWVDLDAAEETLTYKGEKQVMRQARQILQELDTTWTESKSSSTPSRAEEQEHSPSP